MIKYFIVVSYFSLGLEVPKNEKLRLILREISKDPKILEAFYVFLVSYYQYYKQYVEYVAGRGGRWKLYKENVYKQLEERKLDPEKTFREFLNLLDSYNVVSAEATLLVNIIESEHYQELKNLLNLRMRELTDQERILVKKLANYVFLAEDGRQNIDWEAFNKLKALLGDEEFEKALKLFLCKGIIVLHGYRSITSRGATDHLAVKMPPWSHEYLRALFKEYLAENEVESKRLAAQLDEFKEMCPICRKSISGGQKHTSIFGYNVHLKCYEEWLRRKVAIFCPLSSEAEATLAREFLALGLIEGKVLCETPVSKNPSKYSFLGTKRIDLVIRSEDADWVVEVERDLNYEAIGQVLVYSTLWRINNPDRKIVKAIVCESAEQEFLDVANILGIKVFHKI